MKVLRHFFSRQFLIFLIFGGCAALTSIGIGWLLYRGDHALLPYPLAVSTGAVVAIIVNFSLNYTFNFSFRGRSLLAQFQTFALVALVGVVLTAFLAWIFHVFMLMLGLDGWCLGTITVTSKFAAHVLAVGLVTGYSFLAHKFFSFNTGFLDWINRHIIKQNNPEEK